MAATFNFKKVKLADGSFRDDALNKGADWTFQFTFSQEPVGGPKVPIDLTNAVDIRIQVRETFGSPVIVEANFSNGFFTVTDAVNGIAEMRIPGATTALITVPECDAIYDLEIEFTGGIINRKLEGSVEIKDNVTE